MSINAVIPNSLAAWPTLPDDAYVDVRVVAGLFGCAVPTVWRRVRAGLIPNPRKFGSSTRWNVGALRAVLTGEPA
ncbi:helix-turn-helix transcriptional regulator [Paraburkholderia phytofirmans]|uniref:Transcriptional regulator n=1 Tax=Paraburkholderia phytofirmans TaxID=261302 RepID=A0ABW9BQZ6_9BURK